MTICYTQVTYAGVEVKNVLTESIQCAPVYDSTNTDVIGNHYTVEFIGEIHIAGTWEHGIQSSSWETPPPNVSVQSGGTVFDIVRQFLQPRQRFTMINGDATWFDVYPSTVENCNPEQNKEQGDIEHGPRSACQILSVKGSRAVKCRFRVDFTIPPKCEGLPGYPFAGVLHLRWWVADNVDGKTWLTTRRYTGVLRLRNAQTTGSFPGQPPGAPDLAYLKSLFLPPIQRGFRRDAVELAQSPNGLEWHFSITDIEQWAQPPSPATDWSGSFTLSFPQLAITCEQEIRLRLRGERTLKKQALFTLAQFIIDQKLQWDRLRILSDSNSDLNTFMLSQVWEEDLVQNEMNVSARMKIFNVSQWLTGLPEGKSGFTLGDFLGASVTSGMWGAAGLAVPYPPAKDYNPEEYRQPEGTPTAEKTNVFLAALQNPCCVSVIGQAVSSDLPGTYDPAVPTYPKGSEITPIHPGDASTPTYWSTDNHGKAMYMHYAMGSKLHVDTGWRGFPLGKQCSTSSSQATMAFAHLHCPCSIREIKIHASRINAWPQLPKPVHFKDPATDITHVLRHYTVEPYAVQISADGRDLLHEVAATYYYYLDRPYDVLGSDEYLPVGVLPYVTDKDLRYGVIIDGIDRNGSQIAASNFISPSPMLTGKKTP